MMITAIMISNKNIRNNKSNKNDKIRRITRRITDMILSEPFFPASGARHWVPSQAHLQQRARGFTRVKRLRMQKYGS